MTTTILLSKDTNLTAGYIKNVTVTPSALRDGPTDGDRNREVSTLIAVHVFFVFVIIIVVMLCWRRKKKRQPEVDEEDGEEENINLMTLAAEKTVQMEKVCEKLNAYQRASTSKAGESPDDGYGSKHGCDEITLTSPMFTGRRVSVDIIGASFMDRPMSHLDQAYVVDEANAFGRLFDSSGGTLQLGAGGVQLDIPEGAIPDGDTCVVTMRTHVDIANPLHKMPEGERFVTPIAEFDAPVILGSHVKVVLPHNVPPHKSDRIKVYYRQETDQDWVTIIHEKCEEQNMIAIVGKNEIEIMTTVLGYFVCSYDERDLNELDLTAVLLADLYKGWTAGVMFRVYIANELYVLPEFVQALENTLELVILRDDMHVTRPSRDEQNEEILKVSLDIQDEHWRVKGNNVKSMTVRNSTSFTEQGPWLLAGEFTVEEAEENAPDDLMVKLQFDSGPSAGGARSAPITEFTDIVHIQELRQCLALKGQRHMGRQFSIDQLWQLEQQSQLPIPPGGATSESEGPDLGRRGSYFIRDQSLTQGHHKLDL